MLVLADQARSSGRFGRFLFSAMALAGELPGARGASSSWMRHRMSSATDRALHGPCPAARDASCLPRFGVPTCAGSAQDRLARRRAESEASRTTGRRTAASEGTHVIALEGPSTVRRHRSESGVYGENIIRERPRPTATVRRMCVRCALPVRHKRSWPVARSFSKRPRLRLRSATTSPRYSSAVRTSTL